MAQSADGGDVHHSVDSQDPASSTTRTSSSSSSESTSDSESDSVVDKSASGCDGIDEIDVYDAVPDPDMTTYVQRKAIIIFPCNTSIS